MLAVSENAGVKPPEPGSEELWRDGLNMARNDLRGLKDDERSSARAISDARQREEQFGGTGARNGGRRVGIARACLSAFASY
jgi:hypothetical protein